MWITTAPVIALGFLMGMPPKLDVASVRLTCVLPISGIARFVSDDAGCAAL
jgi:hypothetical protein